MPQNKILAMDIGNTNLHWCYMQDAKILGEYNRNKHTELSLLPWEEIKKQNCTIVVAGTLPHINETINRIAEENKIRFVELETSKQNVIKNIYPTLGIDRVCNLIAALKSFESTKSPVVVFDFGTATTITTCDKDGNFLGGVIKTGCEVELKALSSRTFALPHVELAREQKITKLNPLAKSTEDAILHGAIYGQVALLEYYLKSFKKEVHPEPKTIFTGGNSPLISRFLDFKADLVDPYMTIKGIYYCYQASLVHN